ncbi:dolichyl-phosphate beta-D-mannosyltransferase [Haloferax mucosum ATCC BAA-1512]|uniref:Dolichyl-phosphate beta-D-mannosyltransferase n=1 Tax=Haloferax mucosum ATCC BAA-1512 TaxID=662479 RepID=M0IRF7_9EURY|nr:glycosyltransferase family 2 protein [Haloferax mucosum]ELZ98029.1 dolichyl-phosphate beta-D-mannosyltransferase [Haloferax mucosum ATCC BAA-1512]
MYRGNTVGVVVPAYNEERFVGEVIDTVPSFVDRIYAVDDRSTDRTWDVIRSYATRANKHDRNEPETPLAPDGGEQADHRVIPIRHPVNRGRGAAVKTGYERALADEMDIIVVMDGDGQMDPEIMTSLIDPVADGTADYAVGDRLAGPTHWRGMPVWRLFGNLVLSGLTRIASGYWHIRDPQNGYTVLSAAALSDLDRDRLYDRYGFLNDLLVHLNVAEKRVATVPMNARYGDEESGIEYTTFVPGLSFLLLRDFLWRLRVRYGSTVVHPVIVLYVLGVVGVVAGTLRLGRRLVSRTKPERREVAGVAGGLTSLAGAMLLDRRENERLKVRLAGEPADSTDSSASRESREALETRESPNADGEAHPRRRDRLNRENRPGREDR